MISLEDFRAEFINDISASAASDPQHPYPLDVFIEESIEVLRDAYSLITEMEPHFWDFSEGTKKYKNMHINAGFLDIPSNTLNLMFADYNPGDIESITNEFLNNKSKLLINFFENSLKDFFFDAEKSNETVQFANDIHNQADSISRLHLFIVSTNKLSKAVKKLKLSDYTFNNRTYTIDLDVLDIEGIYKSKLASFKKDELVINCEDYGCKGIPCIKADVETDLYDSYLAIVPGKFLSEIYKAHSSELLESNVRSFLKLNGGVNKGIRSTILNDKSKFFTYNNGISTTAKEISLKSVNGTQFITSFKDLQIINGGQTTATLAATSIKDNADLSGIFVQMKLTIIQNADPDLIRNIATYANSQNKVKTADLNSSHPFYIKIEDFSRKIYAPKAVGQLVQQLWFFERARGQYDQPMMQMTTKKQRDEYKAKNPKEKRFTLTDLAKYCNAADALPHYVSWGGEVNAAHFHNRMLKQWEKDSAYFNEYYYKTLIGKKILFAFIEKVISNQQWYQERKAYRPQLVAYTFSKLVESANDLNLRIDYGDIWAKQDVPPQFEKDVALIGKIVFKCIYATQGNIGTYCKQEACWKIVKSKDYTISDSLKKILVTPQDIKISETSSRKDQRFADSIQSEVDIFNKGPKYWASLLERGLQQRIVSAQDKKNLEIVVKYCKMEYAELSKFQLKYALETIKKLKDNGIE